jgi:hypothetical protein
LPSLESIEARQERLGGLDETLANRGNDPGRAGFHRLDIPGAQLEAERKETQAGLALLSKSGKNILIASGHNMQVEAPDVVVKAIRDAIAAAPAPVHP